jgi:TetR/AcrR family transcriptional regulator
VEQFFARLETQFKQILREASMREGVAVESPEQCAALLLALIEGRMHQFLRTRFKVSPLQGWEAQWALLEPTLFR